MVSFAYSSTVPLRCDGRHNAGEMAQAGEIAALQRDRRSQLETFGLIFAPDCDLSDPCPLVGVSCPVFTGTLASCNGFCIGSRSMSSSFHCTRGVINAMHQSVSYISERSHKGVRKRSRTRRTSFDFRTAVGEIAPPPSATKTPL